MATYRLTNSYFVGNFSYANLKLQVDYLHRHQFHAIIQRAICRVAVWSVIKHDLASLIAQEDETAERRRSEDETDPIMMWSSMQQFAPEIRRERNKS